MNKTRTILLVFSLAAAGLLLAACGAQPAGPPAEPTFDSSLLYTAAALTVQADMTQQALNQPTETPAPSPTVEIIQPTALPTLDLAAAEAAAPVVVNTPAVAVAVPARGTPAAPILGAAPVATQALAVAEVKDKATWAGQNPADFTAINAGNSFEMIWSLLNTGVTTWTTDYSYQYWGGSETCTLYSASKTYYLTEPVLPGQKVRVKVPMTAPLTKGTCQQTWVMVNADGQVFWDPFDVTLEIK
jgi:hypothetical protein